MEITYTHRDLGFVRALNVTHFEVSGRVMVYYTPDTERYHIEPVSIISNLEIEDGQIEHDTLFKDREIQ